MDWNPIEVIGGTTALIGALTWLARSTISHFFARELEHSKAEIKALHDQDLERLKHQQTKELESLRSATQQLLAEMQAESQKRLEHVKAALGRIERIEADLLKIRGEAYGEIWRLTGSLNLFGPTTTLSEQDLSAHLKNWYFERGMVLTQESKRRYFLVQEVLSFLTLRSVRATRPPEELLFGSQSRPVDVLRQLRSTSLNIEVRADEDRYTIEELEKCISEWKLGLLQSKREKQLAEEAWLLLQFAMSAFRTALVEELGSRQKANRPTNVDTVWT